MTALALSERREPRSMVECVEAHKAAAAFTLLEHPARAASRACSATAQIPRRRILSPLRTMRRHRRTISIMAIAIAITVFR
jgi:hypothetical protein